MTDAAPTPSDYPALTCQCGATTLTDRDAAPLCLGCPSCGTALRLRGPGPGPSRTIRARATAMIRPVRSSAASVASPIRP
jgi:hypothetical protein